MTPHWISQSLQSQAIVAHLHLLLSPFGCSLLHANLRPVPACLPASRAAWTPLLQDLPCAPAYEPHQRSPQKTPHSLTEPWNFVYRGRTYFPKILISWSFTPSKKRQIKFSPYNLTWQCYPLPPLKWGWVLMCHPQSNPLLWRQAKALALPNQEAVYGKILNIRHRTWTKGCCFIFTIQIKITF